MLKGPAGCGKSYEIENTIMPFFTNKETKECRLLMLGSTHTANLNIKGDGTVDSIRCQLGWFKRNMSNYDAVLVDEVSMLKLHHYQWFVRKWKEVGKQVILVGDFNQCKLDNNMDNFDTHPFFQYLTDYNTIQLRFNKRDKSGLIQELSERVLKGENVLNKIQEQGKTFCPVNLCWTNRTRIKINNMVNEEYNKRTTGNTIDFKYKEIKGNKTTITDVKIKSGCRLVCKKPSWKNSFITEQERGIYNNEHYVYKSSTKTQHIITRKVVEQDDNGKKTIATQEIALRITKKFSELNSYFKLGWCLTIHQVQGHSISENISIHEAQFMYNCGKLAIIYTAITRATDFKYLHIGKNFTDGGFIGFVYLITLNNGKRYVGQTTRKNPKDRLDEHKLYQEIKDTNTNKLYNEMRRVGLKGLKFQSIENIYPSHDDLDSHEAHHIRKYNTIEDGLNTLMPTGLNI